MRKHLCVALSVLIAFPAPVLAVRPTEQNRRDARRFGLTRFERAARRTPSARRKRAFADFNAAQGRGWKARFNPRTGAAEALTEGRTRPSGGPAERIAARFLEEQAEVLGVDPTTLTVERQNRGNGGLRHVLFQQTYRGLPVEFARVKVHLDDTGAVIGAGSSYEPDLNLSVNPVLSGPQAESAAAADAGGQAMGAPQLVVLPNDATGRAHLAWKLRVRAPSGQWRYYVDAVTGQILLRFSAVRNACVTQGTILGQVYDIDPSTTPGPVVKPIMNQWVYVGAGVSGDRALTGGDPVFGQGFFCAAAAGPIAISLQGPWVNASSFRGPSAHYDNGTGAWSTLATPVSSPHPYQNSATHISAVSNVHASAVKVLPVFSSFNVGDFSGSNPGSGEGGDIVDDDQLQIVDRYGAGIASFVGNRGSFRGTAVHGSSYTLVLRSNESGQQSGYDVLISSYMLFTSGPIGNSSHTWTTADTPMNLRSELNVFYHLNKMHDYFFSDINKSSAAPVTRPVTAMTHVGPNNLNAFYDPDYDNLFFGDVSATIPSDAFTDDATVPRHEYVHYLVEKIWPIQNFGQGGALSEAFADYYSASSLSHSTIGAYTLQALGFPNSELRELDCAKKASRCKTGSPNLWWSGEIHNDSEPVAQALWEIRKARVAALGLANGRSCTDGVLFQSLLFFPESFAELFDAMKRVDALGTVTACGGAGSVLADINTAFGLHGLSPGVGVDAHESNDGFESAVDVTTRSSVSATIYPAGDADFWGFSAGPGLVEIEMTLPASGGYHSGYELKLYDAGRRLVATAAPPFNGINTFSGLCEILDCTTTASNVKLSYNNPAGGHLYLQVSGGTTFDGGSASAVNNTSPYSLSFSYQRSGALSGGVVTATFDQDVISFTANVSTFVSVQDWRYSHAQLRDQSYNALSNTDTRTPGGFLVVLSTAEALGTVSGQVRLVPGFAARFPAAGTIHLEVFGFNVMSSTSSLGLSNPINLSAQQPELTAYNNVFNPARGQKAIVKYATAERGRITIKLYTVTGVYVATLLDADMPAGKGSVEWGGQNLSGSTVASGVYVVKAVGPGLNKTQKIIIVK